MNFGAAGQFLMTIYKIWETNMKKTIILPFILIVLTLGLTACDKQQKSTKVVKEETDSVNKVKSEKLIENKDSAQPETSNRAEEDC